ncbi:biotin transporter BioY [Rickettsiaceae bacterium]|nr:biotin transporter BioY [Rickettsiaceae bacterium]
MKKILLQKKDFTINNRLFKVILGVSLIFFSAQAKIPLEPVPITMHPMGVLILALCYERKVARQSMLSYVVLGAIGLPIFTGFTSGVSVLFGTSGGYLFGMILSVYVITALREKFGDDSLLKLAIYSIIGSACVYTVGILQLSLFVGFVKSIEFGLYPFILPGVVKAMLTASSVKLLKKF